MKDRIDNIDKLENRALRRIEYVERPELRSEYDVLRKKYKTESLRVRRKRNLLHNMYDKSKDNDNIEVILHDLNLRSRGKVKMKKNSQD